MSEILEVYDLNSKFLEGKNRSEIYQEMKDERKKNGKITKQVKTIRCLLMNSEWRIYLQKRSKLKSQNTGMYDKTIWWHVWSWQSRGTTLTKECAEELGIPSSIIEDDFEGWGKVNWLVGNMNIQRTWADRKFWVY